MDVRACQCEIPRPVAANPWPAVGIIVELARDPDWRIREWVAFQNLTTWRGTARDSSEDGLLARSWEQLRRTLRTDEHQSVVRMATLMGQSTQQRLILPADPLTPLLAAYPDLLERAAEALERGTIADEPLGERLVGAANHPATAPPLDLMDDPVCQVREAVVAHLDPLSTPPAVIAHFDQDPCHMRVAHARYARFGPPGRTLPIRAWVERADRRTDLHWDPAIDDPALWHGTWHPDYRSTWIYLPAGVHPTDANGRRTNPTDREVRLDGSAWVRWSYPEQLMGAYGPPRACDCMRAYATLLCYFNYDGWHSSYEMKCPACWLPLITWGETAAVAAIWDGAQWRQPAPSDDPTDPQPGAPVNPPAFLPPDRLIVSNSPTAYRPRRR